jgi:hypothetical protein
MANADELYSEVKVDIEVVATPLFEFSEQCIRKWGNFLPHGAVLDGERKVGLVTASPDLNGRSTSTEVLPMLHDDLRAQAKEKELIAIGVAENVTITPDGQLSTQAIKVLFEHKRGLVVALYLPFKKQFLRGYLLGEVFTVRATGEVNAWPANVA